MSIFGKKLLEDTQDVYVNPYGHLTSAQLQAAQQQIIHNHTQQAGSYLTSNGVGIPPSWSQLGGPFHSGTMNQPITPELSEEQIEDEWLHTLEGENIKRDCMTLRAYLMMNGKVFYGAALSMPASLVKKLAKEFIKLETCENILSEVTMGLMEAE